VFSSSSNSSFVEKHVVNVVYDKNMSNDFKKVLNSDGKFVINSVKPTTEEEWWSLFDLLYMIPTDYEWAESNMAEDFSAFDYSENKGIKGTGLEDAGNVVDRNLFLEIEGIKHDRGNGAVGIPECSGIGAHSSLCGK